ncbi:MAG: nucleoside phosphorylase [Oscillospiraceae bacterium]|nr:nucleoside phosphorylase [Oscillospiraceae bacterium]
MSIINAFDLESEAILNPQHLVSRIESFPGTTVAIFDDKIIELVKNRKDTEIISYLSNTQPRKIYRIEHKNKTLAVYENLMGGSASAALLEMMIVKGAKKILFFGTCGSLDKDISSGNFIIPTAAYRDEGTSYHYLEASDYVEIKTADRLSQIMQELSLPHIKAKTWTTDAIFRETKINMLKRKSEGCLTVEMECASIMAVGQFRNIEVYQFLYAEDNLDCLEWESRNRVVTMDSREKYLNIALDIASMI